MRFDIFAPLLQLVFLFICYFLVINIKYQKQIDTIYYINKV